MGLTIHMPHKNTVWTNDKIEKLGNWYYKYPVQVVSRRLGMSVSAIRSKAYCLGMKARCIREGWYTMGEICSILGMNHRTMVKYIKSGELKATFDRQPGETVKPIYHITKQDAKKFIMEHLLMLTGRNIDLVNFVEIVAKNGVEYNAERTKPANLD